MTGRPRGTVGDRRIGGLARACEAPLVREGLAVFAVAFVLLVPGMAWGIPYASGPDLIRGWDVDGIGGIGVLAELNHLRGGDSRGWYVAYPLFHYLVQGAAYLPYLLWLLATGQLGAPSPTYPYALSDPIAVIARLHLITRIISVAMGAGVVALVFVTVRRVATRSDGVVAALLMLLAEPLVFYSHTGNLDVPVLFWCAATMCAAGAAIHRGLTTPVALTIGTLGGLAIATKDQAYAVVVPALAYVAWRAWQAAGGREARRAILAMFGTAAAVFVVAGGVVLWPGRFVMHVRYLLDFEQSFANVRHPTYLTQLREGGVVGVPILGNDMLRAIVEAIGIPSLILAAVALLVTTTRAPEARLVVFSALGAFLLTVVPIRHVQYRYALFPIWAFAVVVGLAGLYARRWSAAAGRVWVIGAAAALLWQGVRAVDFVHQQRADARYAASAWTATHMARGDEVGYFGGTHQLPHLPAGVDPYWLFGDDPNAVRMVYERQFRWIVAAADYFAADSRDHSAIMPDSVWAALNAGSAGYRLVARFETASLIGRGPYFLPYVNPPVRIYERTHPPTAPRLEGVVPSPSF